MKKPKKSGIFKKILLGINFLIILFTLASYSSSFIDPKTIWLVAFFGLAFPLFILLNVLFIIIWALFKSKLFLYSTATLILGIVFIFSNVEIHSKSNIEGIKAKFKIMSYNVRLFDLFNYNKDWSINYSGRNNIFDLLKSENPDIVCFQEYYWDSSQEFKTTDTLIKILKTKNYFTDFPVIMKKNHHFGIATFSKFPIVNKGVIHFPNNLSESAIWTDLVNAQDTFRVFNVHLESIRLGKEDQMYISNLTNTEDPKAKTKQTFKGLLQKFKSSFEKRSEQSRIVAENIKKSPYPVVVCGDFNDTPVSYAYHTVSKDLSDAFVKSGTGFGNTYSGFFPSFRIDYILFTSFFNAYNYTTIPKSYSDHYPIYCYLAPASQNK